jgi:hypothetical protein
LVVRDERGNNTWSRRCRLILIIIHNYICVFSKIVRGARIGSRKCLVTLSLSSDQSEVHSGHIFRQLALPHLAYHRRLLFDIVGRSGLLTIRLRRLTFTCQCKLLIFLKDDFNFKKCFRLITPITHPIATNGLYLKIKHKNIFAELHYYLR